MAFLPSPAQGLMKGVILLVKVEVILGSTGQDLLHTYPVAAGRIQVLIGSWPEHLSCLLPVGQRPLPALCHGSLQVVQCTVRQLASPEQGIERERNGNHSFL